MKIALISILFLFVLVVGLPYSLRQEDSVSSAVQTYLSLSLRLIGFLLALLTVFLSRSVSDEIANKQILMLMAKPLPRWQFVVGKFLGIVLINTSLLCVSGIGLYTGAKLLARMTPRDEFDAFRIKEEVLTARHAIEVSTPDFTATANDFFQRRLDSGGYSNVIDLIEVNEKQRIAKEIATQWRTILPMQIRTLEFDNVRCERSPDQTIQMKYKPTVWRYPPDEILRCLWVVGNPDKGTPVYYIERRDIIGRFHTFSVPADAVAPDHTLTAQFVNQNPYKGEPQYRNTVSFLPDEPTQALFTVGTFGGNLFRLLMLVACRLVVLTAFAVFMTCLFSFPVACLISFTFLATATMAGYLEDSVLYFDQEGADGIFRMVVGNVYRVAFLIIPRFSRYDGTDLFVDGRNVTLRWVLQGIGVLVVIYSSFIMTAACVMFQRREVSETSV